MPYRDAVHSSGAPRWLAVDAEQAGVRGARGIDLAEDLHDDRRMHVRARLAARNELAALSRQGLGPRPRAPTQRSVAQSVAGVCESQ